jgi:flagellin-like protein
MIFRKIRKNVKAISPIIATLLLIAIAVVAALVTYAWVMGYIGTTTNKVGDTIQIQSLSDQNSNSYLTVYVENVGTNPVTFNSPCVYINGQAATGLVMSAGGSFGSSIAPGNTVTFTTTNTITIGIAYTVKVNSEDGTFNSMTYTFTS